MLRAGLLWLSERQRVFRFVRSNRLAQRLAARFVAGETIETAVRAVQELNARGITATLDILGESVTVARDAELARDAYLTAIDQVAQVGAQSHVSVKLTQLGIDVDEELCVANMRAIIDRARARGSFVRIDMEGSAYTERTLQLYARRLHPEFGDCVGVVLQSYLRRTAGDLEMLIAERARVRLCKGAYKEAPEIAFPKKRDVDANYIGCMERLLDRGTYPAIATHDERILARAKAFVRDRGIAAERFEFQMLYGVRRDVQQALRREGYRLRVYVPFGTQWYPYLMRRLAERPANVAFLAGNLMKESLRRS
ncbi:MAG TPA: proline dehydrogenase family protein [Gemmatimonadales bacterium]|nr:proline dehydrogenase family protein [Gemmatimonadales bacterium]